MRARRPATALLFVALRATAVPAIALLLTGEPAGAQTGVEQITS